MDAFMSLVQSTRDEITTVVEMEQLQMRMERPRLIAHADGGYRRSKDLGGIGVVITYPDCPDQRVEISKAVPLGVSNNVTEYKSLIEALTFAVENQASELEVVMDSEVVVKQMNGEYLVRAAHLQSLWAQASVLAEDIPSFKIRHRKREHNALADDLANQAMDEWEAKRAAGR